MFNKNIFHLLLVAALLFIGGADTAIGQSSPTVIKWIIEKNSTLRVDGESNVNSFTCNITEYAKVDTLVCFNDPLQPIILSGKIEMDILSFNCHSNMITKDMRKTLKAEEYPKMFIRFISLQKMPGLLAKTELIKGLLEVELAGVKKTFELSYSFSKASAGSIQLNGTRTFYFSDFKLSPPTKLAGLIKIKDDFVVNFQLMLRPV